MSVPHTPPVASPLDQSLADFLADLARLHPTNRPLPPVHLWNPDRCSTEGDFQIRADGQWFHEGSPIGRESMVKLFATLLRKDDDGSHYLVTPGEKVTVTVADAPFVATRVDRHGAGKSQTLVFTTNVGDLAAAGPDHPLRITYDPTTKQPRPYVLVRGRLEARILRAPFYDMCNAVETERGACGVWSNGVFFPLEPPM